jgi:hypothetical protein
MKRLSAAELERLRKCRLRGHHMDEYDPKDGADLDGWAGRLTFRCVTCGTTRHDYVDGYGEVGSRRYRWPDGYKVAMQDMPVKPELRLIVLFGRKR